MEADQGHPIKVVVLRTGLSPHVIRVWEKRYGAVEPMRTPTNRRRYTDADIERLLLLQRATQIGRSIGQIAQLPTETLRNLVREDEAARLPAAPQPVSRPAPVPTQSYLDACLNGCSTPIDTDQQDGTLLASKGLRRDGSFFLLTTWAPRWGSTFGKRT